MAMFWKKIYDLLIRLALFTKAFISLIIRILPTVVSLLIIDTIIIYALRFFVYLFIS